ncbi:hypothetical protein D1007_23762 [Hordeum vulgare]|nr:hypothetical protein D1007_23762 [Hordeum vulgare]
MSNPTFYTNSAPHSIPPRQQQQEHQFKLYMSQIVEGTSGTNQLVVANNGRSDYFGITVAMDWVIRDDLGPKANIVAHAKGLEHLQQPRYAPRPKNAFAARASAGLAPGQALAPTAAL